jgi:aspartyl-tRNA(Asn)/glutamyl-tRNA(Gln) amidotransferase subunit A
MTMDMSRRDFIQTSAAMTAYLGFGPTLRVIPNGDDLAFLTISELSELIRTKKVSPIEVTRLMLQRIEKLNPVLNAYITVTSEQALKSAQNAEKEIQQNKWRGQLHGVPVALKDLFDTAGVRTTAASALFKDRVPEQDAEVVRKLKAAGAVLLGKLNMHEFAYGASSTVSYFGVVHNPWESTYVTGGSSGGSAAAVAAGLCFGALGSDTGGSIREPAAYCGIVGLKPTYALVSTRGAIPLSWSLDHVGPMTRTVADAAIMLQAIAGYDEQDITSQHMTVPNYTAALRSKTSSLRLGIPREFFFSSLDPEIEAATTEALSVLSKLTAGVKEVKTIPVGNITDRTVVAAEAYAYHAEFVAKSPEQYQKPTLAAIRAGAEIRTRDYIMAHRELASLRQRIRQAFESVDAIVTPTTPIAPPAISAFDAAYKDPSFPTDLSDIRRLTLRNTGPFDKYGLPTISVPCGFTPKGLPVGVQISGPYGGETVVLQLAHAYEQTTEWHKKHPTIS